MSTYKTAAEYLDSLKSGIKSGTRGAPARRERYCKIRDVHARHSAQLICSTGLIRSWQDKHPEHRALVLAARGCEFDGYHYERAMDNQRARLETARECSEMRPIIAKIAALPINDLIDYYNSLNRGSYGYNQYDSAYQYQTLSAELVRYCARYINAKNDLRIAADESVIAYDEDTEWERYGSRSYPRVCNRRIIRITRTGSETIRMLDAGERAENAIDTIIPERAQQRKIAALMEQVKKIECYKVVARRDDGALVSVFSSDFTYDIGRIAEDTVKLTKSGSICSNGGIFVHTTREAALAQEFPDESANANLPRVLLRGEAWGKKNENKKIAAEYFLPLEMVETVAA